jgi:hypothetical protein
MNYDAEGTPKEYNKYKAFRQYMTNELGITKGDIEIWTKEAVKEQVRAIIDSKGGETFIREMVFKWLNADRNSWYRDGGQKELSAIVKDVLSESFRIEVAVTSKSQNLKINETAVPGIPQVVGKTG